MSKAAGVSGQLQANVGVDMLQNAAFGGKGGGLFGKQGCGYGAVSQSAPPVAPPSAPMACGAAPPASQLSMAPSWLQQPPSAEPKLVLLAPATAHVVPTSSKSKDIFRDIALKFVNADKATQTQMLQNPSVARAILQTLAVNSGGAAAGGGSLAPMAAMLGGQAGPAAAVAATPPPAPAPPMVLATPLTPGSTPATSTSPKADPPKTQWSGMITLARNSGKRLQARSSLLYGKIEDVEVTLRSAGVNANVLDITHRVPFEEASRRISGSTILSIMPVSPADQIAHHEYATYFCTKNRSGMVRLENGLALYVLPPSESVPCLRDGLLAAGYSTVPGCLWGLVAQGNAPAPAQTAAAKAAATKAAAAKASSAAPTATPAFAAQAGGASASVGETASVASKAAGAEASAPGSVGEGAKPSEEDDSEGLNVSSKELLDMFSNPELIKLLSDEGAGAAAS